MAQFRRRPLVVEAEQWWPDHPVPGVLLMKADRPMGLIATPGELQDTHHYVAPGDWIVTGFRGERYPVSPATFEATYAPVEVVKAPPA